MIGSARPRFHFTPSTGWINDPYGVIWHDGRYHLFFQHLPGQVRWGPEQHWGHAVSDDLVRWTEQDVVLSPDALDGGIWSGSVVRTDSGGGRMFYTAVRLGDPQIGTVRAARPVDPSWNVWRKEAMVAGPPEGLRLAAFRDPYVLHDDDAWRMLVGAGTTDGTALALSWTSPDLNTWTYDGVLASRPASEVDPVWTGTVWECPQLFRVADAWVLVVSVWAEHQTRYEAYAVGDLVDGQFLAKEWRRLTYGPGHYAGSAFTDSDGRVCLLHWIRDVVDPEGGWAGAHSVPHVLSLQGAGWSRTRIRWSRPRPSRWARTPPAASAAQTCRSATTSSPSKSVGGGGQCHAGEDRCASSWTDRSSRSSAPRAWRHLPPGREQVVPSPPGSRRLERTHIGTSARTSATGFINARSGV